MALKRGIVDPHFHLIDVLNNPYPWFASSAPRPDIFAPSAPRPDIFARHGDHASIRLSGFSWARVAGEPELVAEGAVFGDPRWMAPEQRAGRTADARTDLYALGLVLHALLEGDLPQDDPGSAREPALPLGAVCLRLLAEGPEARYPSAHALLGAL